MTIEENRSKDIGKRSEIQNRIKHMIFQNNERKYSPIGGEFTNQQSNTKETKQICSMIWEQKEHNRKAECVNNIKKELQ